MAELEAAWWEASERYDVLPLDDGYAGRMPAVSPPAYPVPSAVRYRPGAGRIADEALPVMMRGFTITTECIVGSGGASGILWAMGDWTSGIALYCRDGRLVLALCLSGDQFQVSTDSVIDAAATSVACRYEPVSADSSAVTLLVDDEVAGSLELDRTLPNSWQNGGTGLIIGYDTGFPVCEDYEPPFPWNGTISYVDVSVPDARPADPTQIARESLNAD